MMRRASAEDLVRARKYAAAVDWSLAAGALDPGAGFADHVTYDDKLKFIERHRTLATEIERGLHDHNFTVWQRMNYFLTGECVGLLPKY